MIKLDDDLLAELGLSGLPPEEKKKLLAHIYETLEMRVGMKLAEQMTNAQLSEFEQFIDRNDEGGALRWLELNFPNYKDVVAAEFQNLKAEISQVAPQILSASRHPQPAQHHSPQPPTYNNAEQNAWPNHPQQPPVSPGYPHGQDPWNNNGPQTPYSQGY